MTRFKIWLMGAVLVATASTFGAVEAKTVLVTGASRGIGLATAKEFAQRGWHVWGASRTVPDDVDTTLGIEFRQMNVTDDDAISAVVDEIIATDGTIDAVINNAGYGLLASVEEATIDEAKEQFDVNFFGVLRVLHAVLPHMREAGGGHIINISSTSGIRAVSGLGLYAGSKFALEGLSEALAGELSPWNVHVTLVQPGSVNNTWGRRCERGSRKCGVNAYTTLTDKLYANLLKLAATGQECADIAIVIADAAESDAPDLRVQASAQAHSVAAGKLLDATGNTQRDAQVKLVSQLLNACE